MKLFPSFAALAMAMLCFATPALAALSDAVPLDPGRDFLMAADPTAPAATECVLVISEDVGKCLLAIQWPMPGCSQELLQQVRWFGDHGGFATPAYLAACGPPQRVPSGPD